MVCDVCGELIKDGKMALVKWNADSGEVIACHKITCDKKSPGARSGDDPWPWEEFGQFLVYLVHSTGIDFEEEEKLAKMLSDPM